MSEALQWLIDNANAANAVGALGGALAAFLALVVSGVSVVLSIQALRVQRQHNALSVTPLPEVAVEDYEDSLRVTVRNNGTGPLIFKPLRVTKAEESRASIIAWMPDDLPGGRMWTNYAERLEERSLSPSGAIVLLELTQYEGEPQFYRCRDVVRRALRDLTVEVKYTDVYGTDFPPYVRQLDWFGRHLKNA